MMKTADLKKYILKPPLLARNMMMDLLWIVIVALMPLAMYHSDPGFLAMYGRSAVIIAAAALPVLLCEMFKGPRKIVLSAAVLFQVGMILQLRLLWLDRDNAAEAGMKLVAMAVCCAAAAMLLAPYMARLIRAMSASRSVMFMNLCVAAVYLLLLFFDFRVNGSSGWIKIIGYSVSGVLLLAQAVLVIFGLIFTDPKRSDGQKIRDAVITLAVNAVFLVAMNHLVMLAVLSLVCVLLGVCCLPKRTSAFKLVLALVLPVAAVCLMGWGCYVAANSMEASGVLGDVLHTGAALFRKILYRVSMLTSQNGMDIMNEGYQAYRAGFAIENAVLLGAGAATAVPAGTTDLAFCMLLNQMGLLTGLAVLVVLMVLLRGAFRVCAEHSDSGVGGVGAAFTLFLGIQALLSASGAVGLLGPMGVSFLFLSRSNGMLIIAWLMIAFILWEGSSSGGRGGARGAGIRAKRAGIVFAGLCLWAVLILLRILITWL